MPRVAFFSLSTTTTYNDDDDDDDDNNNNNNNNTVRTTSPYNDDDDDDNIQTEANYPFPTCFPEVNDCMQNATYAHAIDFFTYMSRYVSV